MGSSYSSRSPWLIHYDGSSCNGCDIEVLDSLTPLYDIERFGIINTGNPKHADIFLVTGSVNAQNQAVVRGIYDQMLEPKVVVACGACACTGGVFRECYNVLGGVDRVIPVDVYAPGCAVRPETIIDAVLEGVKALDEKAERMRRGRARGNRRKADEGGVFGEDKAAPSGGRGASRGNHVILSEGRRASRGSHVIPSAGRGAPGVEGSHPGPESALDQRGDPSTPPLRGSAQDDKVAAPAAAPAAGSARDGGSGEGMA